MLRATTHRKLAFGTLSALLLWIALMGLSPHPVMTNSALELFDVTWQGYNADHAARVISALGDQGRRTYAYWRIPLDMVFPLLYGMTLYVLLEWAAVANGLSTGLRTLVVTFPIMAAVSDLIENTLIFAMVSSEPPKIEFAPFASAFTQLKCLSLVSSILLLISLGARAIWLHVRTEFAPLSDVNADEERN